ncbi:MAG: thioredoxin domain-containing protein [Bdellovibrionales bacterium]|nr:thioredoxin domain-containing protein [Bdellovibrionales bacterium]
MKLSAILLAVLGLSMAACSPSATQLKKVMQENPDILHAAIKADPKGFFDVIQEVQGKAREQSMADQMAGELTRVLEEMKNPKVVAIDEERAIVGPKDAKVTIVEWADFNCGHCSTAASTMERIAEEYKDNVRIIYKHLPILAKESRTAAEYMEAIAMQDKAKALKFHSEVFAEQKELRSGGEKFLKEKVASVGADLKKVLKDIKSDVVKKRIDSDVAEAQKFEFNGTPGFMVNGAGVHGAYPYDFFKKVIDTVIGSGQK